MKDVKSNSLIRRENGLGRNLPAAWRNNPSDVMKVLKLISESTLQVMWPDKATYYNHPTFIRAWATALAVNVPTVKLEDLEDFYMIKLLGYQWHQPAVIPDLIKMAIEFDSEKCEWIQELEHQKKVEFKRTEKVLTNEQVEELYQSMKADIDRDDEAADELPK